MKKYYSDKPTIESKTGALPKYIILFIFYNFSISYFIFLIKLFCLAANSNINFFILLFLSLILSEILKFYLNRFAEGSFNG